jgi:hypothetical protein
MQTEPLKNIKEIPKIDVHQPLAYDETYYGDEYYETSMYSNQNIDSTGLLTPSPKKSKRLPNTASSTSASQKMPTTPSIIMTAGAGLSSLFSSISNTLHSPAATTSSSLISPSVPQTTSNSFSAFSTAYNIDSTSYANYDYGSLNSSYGTTSALNFSAEPTFTTNYDTSISKNSFSSTPFSTSHTISFSTSTEASYSTVVSSSYAPLSYTTVSSSYTPFSYTPMTTLSSTLDKTFTPSTAYSSSLNDYNTISSYSSTLYDTYKPVVSSSYDVTSELDKIYKPAGLTSYDSKFEIDDIYKPLPTTSYQTSFELNETYKPIVTTSSISTLDQLYKPVTTSFNSASEYNQIYTPTTTNFNSASEYNQIYTPTTSNFSSASEYHQTYTPATTNYNSILDKIYTPSTSLNAKTTSYEPELKFEPAKTTASSSSSLFGPLSSLFSIGTLSSPASTQPTVSSLYNTTSDSLITSLSTNYDLTSTAYAIQPTTSSYNIPSISSYNTSSTVGILGHSPIPEEAENETSYEESYPETSVYTPFTMSTYDDYKVPISSYNSIASTSSLLGTTNTSSDFNSTSYLPSISETYYVPSSTYDVILEDKIEEEEEEYREDFEEGVVPPIVSIESDFDYKPLVTIPTTTMPVTTSGFTTSLDDYFYENSAYPMTSKLSTIPETVSDIYMSSNDLQEETETAYDEQLTTPGAYDYTENENDYIASGDLKNTNLYQQPNYTSQQTLPYQTQATAITSSNVVTSSTSMSSNTQQQQPQPEPKKSRFGLGSLFSDGLNVIGSSVNTIKSTATNLAGGAVGVVGGVAAAAAAAAQSTQSSNQQNNHNANNLGQQQNVTTGSSVTNMQQNSYTTSSSMTSQQTGMKLTKQVSEMFDEHNEGYMEDPYDVKQDQYNYEPDYFNEEEEERYLEEHNSSENNNYMSPTYGNQSDEYASHLNDNNSDTYGMYNNNNSKSQIHNNSSKLNRNDSNNNANGVYDYRRTSYDDRIDDKTKLGLNNNTEEEEYYEMYEDENEKDDRHYEEEFDNEYAQDSSTTKQMVHKQMSILDDDVAHHDYVNDKNKMMLNGEQKTIDDEYLDEFDEEGMSRRKSDLNSFMKKQESIMEDDPELRQLEETQNLKNQQQQQHYQNLDHDKELDHFDIEMKQKKSVTISDDEVIVHEKPREKRTAKQRWHWAYNRIVHQAQVSLYQN